MQKCTFFFNSHTSKTITDSTVEVLCLNDGAECKIKHGIPSYV